MPRLAPDRIRGVRVAYRAPLRVVPRLVRQDSTTWRVVGMDEIGAPASADSDEALWQDGFVVVVPMRAVEVDFERLVRWRRAGVALPAWRPGQDLIGTSSAPLDFQRNGRHLL